MEELTFENAMYSWLIFWLVYWLSGIYLTWKNSEKRPVTDLAKVLNSLGLNMVWTFIGTIIIFYIPIRLVTSFNLIIRLVLCNIITEIYFYHCHAWLHHQIMYKRFHKQHHFFSSNFFTSKCFIFIETFSIYSVVPICCISFTISS